MNGKKQSRQDLIEKKITALLNVIQHLADENVFLKDLAIGTLETVKQMPGYNEALEKVKQKALEEENNNEPKLEL